MDVDVLEERVDKDEDVDMRPTAEIIRSCGSFRKTAACIAALDVAIFSLVASRGGGLKSFYQREKETTCQSQSQRCIFATKGGSGGRGVTIVWTSSRIGYGPYDHR